MVRDDLGTRLLPSISFSTISMAGLSGFKFTPEMYFGGLTLAAKDLDRLEKAGKTVPSTGKYDFGVQEACSTCQQNIKAPKKALRCSVCKAVLYCSKECAKRAWSTPPAAGHPTHKELCDDNARHMQRLPVTTAILTQFPWGLIERDGSFNTDIARGRFGVLGGSGMGFWSHKGGPVPHQQQGPFASLSMAPGGYAEQLSKMLAGFDHLDGKDLLGKKHLTDEEGWKLPLNFIPFRHFASDERRPILVTDFGESIKDWDSWYRWRKLPKESIAALLMTFPLSVYQLLVHCLEITNPNAGEKDKRIPLHVQILGVEIELNYIPLFSELALLLPYHDIKLVMFGHSPHKLVAEAKSKHLTSIAAKSSSTQPIFSYKAPQGCGSGKIDIFLHGHEPSWCHLNHSPYGNPDALIACNAGLGSYPDWIPVIKTSHELEIPFGVTEYAEQSCEHQRRQFPRMIGPGVKPRKEYAIDLNPFQSPGQRGIPQYRLPNVVNGFTITVVKKEK